MTEFLIGMIGSRPMEWVAVICGLLNVLLIIRRSVWNYPFGFVMVVFYFVIFTEYQLYSDAILQIYFFCIQIYGLWYWLQGRGSDGRIVVAPLRPAILLFYILITLVGWILLGAGMERFTDAVFPFWDAGVAALSVTAQFLLSRRHQQSWIFWILVDVLAIGLFLTRGLTPTAALYAVFLVLAVAGWIEWRRAPREPRIAAA